MRKVLLFIASSLDGYIARADGKVDWLFSDGDYGFRQFYDSIDIVLVGRKAYEQASEFSNFPFEKKKCYVFTKQPNVMGTHGQNVEFVDNVVGKVEELIRSSGKDIWLVGGSEIISVLLSADLINEIIVSVRPIIIGSSGIPLFRNMQNPSCLKFVNSKTFGNGLVQLHYEL